MSTGTAMLIAALALSLLFGLYRLLSDGRFRGTRKVAPDPGAPSAGVGEARAALQEAGVTTFGERATLIQFSSAFCAPCRATRRILGDIADVVPGVVHVEIDAEQHLELVRGLGIARTPTTLILDVDGVERLRAVGAPRKEAVLSGLAQALGE